MPFNYVESLNRYRNISNGRFVAQEDVLAYVDSIIGAGAGAGSGVASAYNTGMVSAADFGRLLKEELKDSYIQNGVLGRGGRALMDSSDWGWIGHELRLQYEFIDAFVEQLPDLSPAEINRRAMNYFGASRSAYERGNARAHGLPSLPNYPASCQAPTSCCNNCGCHLEIVKLDNDGNADVFWQIDPQKENCKGCVQLSEQWNPLRIRNGEIQ